MQLRSYQREAIISVRDLFKAGIFNLLVVLPTGTGKTVVFSHLAKGRAMHGNGPTLILAHRDELLIQARKKILEVWPEAKIGLIKAESDDWKDKDIVVASVQTLKNEARMLRLPKNHFKTIITDEAHHAVAASYQKIYDYFLQPGVLHVGFTATPQRGDKSGLGRTFKKVAYYKSMAEMIAEGWLCPLINQYVNIAIDFNLVKSTAGDFSAIDLALEMNTNANNKAIVEAWKQYAAGRKKTVAFCVDVDHAIALRDTFRTYGIKAEMVYGEMEANERRRILDDFAAGNIPVLCNIEVLTEGWDEPGVDCILSARPTQSAGLYIQMVGRGTRTLDGKDNCLVLDVVGNAVNHKLQTLPSIYSGAARQIPRSAKEAAKEAKARKIKLPQSGATRVIKSAYSQFKWIESAEDEYIFSAKDVGTLRIWYNPGIQEWEIQEVGKYDISVLKSYGDKDVAFMAAEAYAVQRVKNPRNLMAEAYWRKGKPTKAQLNTIRSFGIDRDLYKLTCGEASDIITLQFTSQKLSRFLSGDKKRMNERVMEVS